MTVAQSVVSKFTQPPIRRSRKSWMKLIALGSGARVFALGSQFIVLLMLSRILDRNQFGELMIVFALYRMIALGLGSGIGSIVLFHVGRSGGDHVLDVRLRRTASAYGLLISATIAIGFALLHAPVANWFSKPELDMWLVHMSPFILFSTLNFVAMGSLEGRSRINSAIMMSEVGPNALRLVALPLVALFDLPSWSIAHVMWVSVAIPWVFQLRSMLDLNISGFQALRSWDFRYAGLYVLNTIASQQLQGIDMLLVGTLFDSRVAASYAISSRIATLFPFFQQIILRNFMPRAGFLLSAGNLTELNSELARNKHWSVLTVCGLTGLILVGAPLMLPLFGDYLTSMPLLVALAAPAVARSLFAGSDIVLKMSGRAGYSFAIAILSAFLVVIVPLLTHGSLGIYAVPIGMMVSAMLLNPVVAIGLQRHNFFIVRLSDIPVVTLGLLSLAAALQFSNPVLSGLIAGGGLLVVACVFYLAARWAKHV